MKCGPGEFKTMAKFYRAPGVIPAPRCFKACELFYPSPQSSPPKEGEELFRKPKVFVLFANARLGTILIVKPFIDRSSDSEANEVLRNHTETVII
jgi:hypothetical protein